MKKVGVLISGRGSNLGALIEAQSSNDKPGAAYKIVLVISNNADAGGLARAQEAGIATLVIPHKGKSREEFDGEMDVALQDAGVELAVLAGFMRVLKDGFLRAFAGRTINIHPSLLPSFPGLQAWRQALEHLEDGILLR